MGGQGDGRGMDLLQLLIDLGVLAGILLFGVLAVVPLWLDGQAQAAQRFGDTQRHPRGSLPGSGPISRTFTSPMSV